MRTTRKYALRGFFIGFCVVALSSLVAPLPESFAGWLYWGVECALIGLLLGASAGAVGWVKERKAKGPGSRLG